MFKDRFRVLAVAASGLCLGAGCVAALAQSVQSNSPGADKLGEIVVTARRVEERLQDVPISIEVLTARRVEERNLTSAEDLIRYIPSLAIATNSVIGRDSASFSLRGFTQESRTTASVATYFADVPAPRPGASIAAGDGAGPGMLFDVQSIQVLKGAQGTLFGRNTTGGAVLIVPNKPGSSFGGYAEALGGSYDWKGLQAAVDLPINDQLRTRVAVQYQKRDGFTQTSGIDSETGQAFSTRLDDRDFVAARASLVWDITPNLEDYLVAYSVHSTTNGSSQPVFGCNPAVAEGPFVCSPLGGNAFGAQQSRTSPFTSSDIAHPYADIKQYGVINNITWHATDQFNAKNIFSYQGLVTEMESDLFGTDINIPPSALAPGYPPAATHILFTTLADIPGTHMTDESTITEEIQLQGSALNSNLNWQGGLYIEDDLPLGWAGTRSASFISCRNWTGAAGQLDCSDTFGSGVPGTYAGDVEDRLNRTSYHNYGVYTQSTYSLSEHWAITGGARYTWDQVNATGEGAYYHFAPFVYTPPLATICSKPQVTYNPALGVSGCAVDFTAKSSAPTWVIDAEYKPTSDLMAYLKYARGYRQAGVSTDAAPGFEVDKPEHVDTYEGGLKSTFHVGSVATLLNGAVFYNNLKDQQLDTGIYINNLTNSDGIINAGKSRIWGAELDASIRPFAGLELDLDYTYLNTDLESITLPTAPPNVLLVPSYQVGAPLPMVPENKATASLTYALPLDAGIGTISLGATGVYISQQLNGPSTNPYRFVPSVALLNLNASWEHVAGGPVDISFFGTNVANRHYLETANDLNGSGTVGFESGRYGEPRMLGAKVRYRFGAQK